MEIWRGTVFSLRILGCNALFPYYIYSFCYLYLKSPLNYECHSEHYIKGERKQNFYNLGSVTC